LSDLIRVEGASKRFGNGVVVFEGLDLEVAEGETLCLLGLCGSINTSNSSTSR
jgi:ABC-type Fe3+/spermidine/putrescine transport system ATPase subunit